MLCWRYAAPYLRADLLHICMLQAVSMRKHLELNRKDKDGKFRLILVESRIHRLARYYRVRTAPCHAVMAPVHSATHSFVKCPPVKRMQQRLLLDVQSARAVLTVLCLSRHVF